MSAAVAASSDEADELAPVIRLEDECWGRRHAHVGKCVVGVVFLPAPLWHDHFGTYPNVA